VVLLLKWLPRRPSGWPGSQHVADLGRRCQATDLVEATDPSSALMQRSRQVSL
jgi:hypothetical protein